MGLKLFPERVKVFIQSAGLTLARVIQFLAQARAVKGLEQLKLIKTLNWHLNES